MTDAILLEIKVSNRLLDEMDDEEFEASLRYEKARNEYEDSILMGEKTLSVF
jgi:hypothetical protein